MEPVVALLEIAKDGRGDDVEAAYCDGKGWGKGCGWHGRDLDLRNRLCGCGTDKGCHGC